MHRIRPGLALVVVFLLTGSVSFAEEPRGVRESVHGLEVADPFRDLEQLDAPATRRWVADQVARGRAALDADPRFERFRRRIEALTALDGVSVPTEAGDRLFFLQTPAATGRPSAFVLEAGGAEPRVLIDEKSLGPNERLAGLWPSPDGRRLAYGVGDGATGWIRVKLLEITSGQPLQEVIGGVRASAGAPSWRRDGSSFFYARYPDAPRGAGMEPKRERHQLFEHRPGSDAASDRLVFEHPAEPDWVLTPTVSDDGRYLVVSTSPGSAPGTRIDLFDLRAPERGWRELVPESTAPTSFVDLDGETMLLQTFVDAPRGRIVAMDLASPAPAAWRTVVPEAQAALYFANAVAERLVAVYLADAKHVAKVFSRDGRFEREIAFPDIGTTFSGFVGRPRARHAYFSFNSIAYPGAATVFRLDPRTGESESFRRPELGYDPRDHVTRQVFFRSTDGTRVPMFLAHRRDRGAGAPRATILYAYGAFGWAATPWFQPQMLAWMEAGGVFALANIRGGGEYGLDWYQGGVGANRQNAIDDYFAAADWLVSSGTTSKELLVMNGGSASGALPALALALRPDRFRAALIDIPILDMVRFDRFAGGARWVSEFGDPADPKQLSRLLAQSPYHRLADESCYPATLVTAGERDDVAVPSHAYKFVARLEQSQTCESPIALEVVEGGGHGFGTTREQSAVTYARQLTFLARALPERAIELVDSPRDTNGVSSLGAVPPDS